MRTLFAVAFGASAVRWVLVARATTAGGLVGLQLFHGLTFGLWWGAAVESMGRVVPSRLRATGQALFSAIVFGAGNAAGYLLAGRAYDAFGSAAPAYLFAGAVELIPLALLVLPLTRAEARA